MYPIRRELLSEQTKPRVWLGAEIPIQLYLRPAHPLS